MDKISRFYAAAADFSGNSLDLDEIILVVNEMEQSMLTAQLWLCKIILTHLLYKRRSKMKVSSFVLVACFMFLLVLGSAQAEKFTLVILPDTQYYLDQCSDKDIYLLQTQWIAENADSLNIKFVAHMGDVVNDGSSTTMWGEAKEAHQVLHQAGIPFNIVLGNHDYSDDIFLRDAADYIEAFGSFDPPWYDGHMGVGIENTYTVFSAEGLDFLVISLEYAPTKDALCWADEVIADYPTHRVIVVTHGYMTYGGNRYGATAPSSEPTVIGSDGWNLWDELIQRHSNIFMVLCGHVNDSEHRQRSGLEGNVIHEILTDYQYEAPLNSGIRCGNGWLRLLEFDTEMDSIHVSTISVNANDSDVFIDGIPWFYETNAMPWSDKDIPTYSADPDTPDHQFSLFYDMTSDMNDDVHTINDAHFNDRTVNFSRSGNQKDPAIAMDPSGNFVVVWEEKSDSTICMRGFTAGGCQRFMEYRVDAHNSDEDVAENPDIAMDADGNFVVVWQYDSNDNDIWGVWARRFSSDGSPLGDMFAIYPTSDADQRSPAVAMAPNGDFVVVWADEGDDVNGSYEIYGSGFYSNGNPRFGPITINSLPDDSQEDPDIAMDENGNFVVVWMDNNGEDEDIEYRCFDSGGNPPSLDALANNITTGEHNDPAIAMAPNGDFVIVWQYDSNDNDVWGVWARRFASNGSPLFGMFALHPDSDANQENAEVSMNAGGSWVCVWQDWEASGLLARGYRSTGAELFSFADMEQTVNTETNGTSGYQNLAFNTDGTFVTVWEDDSDGNSYTDIVSRGIRIYDLIVMSNGGGSVYWDTPNGPSGSKINISAQPDSGWTFSHWTDGAEDQTAAETYVFMDRLHIVTASFEQIIECGDINGNGDINILDVLFLINYLYKSGPAPVSEQAVDVNNSGSINIMDGVYMINYLYKGGPEPICP